MDDSSSVAVEDRGTARARAAADVEGGDRDQPALDGRRGSATLDYGFAACSRAACGSAGSTVEAADGVGCKERRWISARY